MHRRLSGWAVLILVTALCSGAQAGEDKTAPPSPEPAVVAPAFQLSGEFDASESYVGSADVRRNGRSDSLDEHNSEVSLVFTPRISLGYLRIGAEWTRYSFGYSGDGTPLPNTLQAVSLVLGLDKRFSDSILVRFEAQPGLYGTSFSHLNAGQIKVPFLIGGTYIYSPDLQFIVGVSVDVERQYPVIPGAGVRWKFAPDWVFNGVLPAPRLEYSLSRVSTLYVGAELKDETFRTDGRDGTSRLDRRLNHALVNFSEVRVGAGLVQKLSPTLSLTAEGGCQPYREFDYQRADIRYAPSASRHTDSLRCTRLFEGGVLGRRIERTPSDISKLRSQRRRRAFP